MYYLRNFITSCKHYNRNKEKLGKQVICKNRTLLRMSWKIKQLSIDKILQKYITLINRQISCNLTAEKSITSLLSPLTLNSYIPNVISKSFQLTSYRVFYQSNEQTITCASIR